MSILQRSNQCGHLDDNLVVFEAWNTFVQLIYSGPERRFADSMERIRVVASNRQRQERQILSPLLGSQRLGSYCGGYPNQQYAEQYAAE
jgi:hypothetical protein